MHFGSLISVTSDCELKIPFWIKYEISIELLNQNFTWHIFEFFFRLILVLLNSFKLSQKHNMVTNQSLYNSNLFGSIMWPAFSQLRPRDDAPTKIKYFTLIMLKNQFPPVYISVSFTLYTCGVRLYVVYNVVYM